MDVLVVPIFKTMACLANSRKSGGRCIAGREYVDGQVGDWIRPVSDREGEEVSRGERQYEDGSEPGVMDIIEVSLHAAQPGGCQSENWLIDPGHHWKFRGRIMWEDLERFADPIESLWSNGSSTQNGENDQMTLGVADQQTNSLRLIKLSDLRLHVYAPRISYGSNRRRVQAHFTYNGESYKLWVTDPDYEHRYRQMGDGEYEVGECYATVSIGEPYREHRYKMVAAIIKRPE